MSLNPLQNLGASLPLGISPGISKHAQNFSVSKLQQKRDRENAKVSMDRAIRGDSNFFPTTSVSHIQGNSTPASSSVFHAGTSRRSIYDEEEYDEVRDRLRYAHIRGMMKEKQAEEAAARQQPVPSKYDVGVKTGGGFRVKGRMGVKRRLEKMRKYKPATYKNISNKDIKYFEDLIKPHTKAVSRGTGIGRISRRDMKLKVERDRRKGIVSWEDAKDMKKMVDNLPH